LSGSSGDIAAVVLRRDLGVGVFGEIIGRAVSWGYAVVHRPGKVGGFDRVVGDNYVGKSSWPVESC
jgi:hypothetical protein